MNPTTDTTNPTAAVAEKDGPDLGALRSERAGLAARLDAQTGELARAEAESRAALDALHTADDEGRAEAFERYRDAGFAVGAWRASVDDLHAQAEALDARITLAANRSEIADRRAAAVAHVQTAAECWARRNAVLAEVAALLEQVGPRVRDLDAQREEASRGFVGQLRALARTGLDPAVILDGIEAEVPTAPARDERFVHVQNSLRAAMAGAKDALPVTFATVPDGPDAGPLTGPATTALAAAVHAARFGPDA